ncbi:putative lipoprotein [Treponema primitia ZAS-2]|uniref:Putative lipoprotein n=1 Tax=Treponema primitia (strain ATCC BAA-887 / DSM 12427 / ZAS-2) TaxID=545694 RepID=F5YIX7_TREPZ|nr:lipoprotein [Treponema primitia]AEF84710.1 putative lipoprotein [Treponema primitia ZAS-2]
MKSKLFVWTLFTLAATVTLALTGCVSTENTNTGHFGEHIRTPVKDFQPMGLVFTETRLATYDSVTANGQIFTYQALLKQAQELGADAIINVSIDKRSQVTTLPGSTVPLPNSHVTTWYGSALAIKYTDTLTETGSVTVTADGATATTVTTSVYFNDGGPIYAGSTAAEQSAGEQAPAPKKGIRQ